MQLRTTFLIIAIVVGLGVTSAWRVLAIAESGPAATLCSGGGADGTACSSDGDCPDGACVRAHAVCDGGGDARYDCPCPGGTCQRGSGCGGETDQGTCVGGVRAGQCCEPLVGCADAAPCVATSKICLSGPEKGFGCLRDAHCPGGTCGATGRVCSGGILDRVPCVDPIECAGGGTCLGWVAPTPIPGSCVGDCDASGDVTVDEVLMLVNIGLGFNVATACPAGDANGDNAITVDEIITAVRNGLEGCQGGG